VRFACKVLTLRETLIGGKQKGSEREQVLNNAGVQGWRCHSVIKADVPGRVPVTQMACWSSLSRNTSNDGGGHHPWTGGIEVRARTSTATPSPPGRTAV
jgi:hypothetical protein